VGLQGFDLVADRTLGHAAARRLAIILETVANWQERAAQRHRLAGLDERMLRDVGLTGADIRHELEKPFWRS
jgi:uncharacterized protein YjiS (DUF1127 family)